ncbi:MAG: rRNA ((1518)-N(6)/adenine(1519)-N(6))-dimethyltransferase [Bacteriovoracaceae bacterium]|nr:rRNA ((1518)-N(6)/adenine(1519)-N(6))-dimethyltransferase [Bacteriovoracaceae bacterium]
MSRTFLGQNFLINEKFQQKIVNYFKPTNGFMEIGPGKAALTKHLKGRYKDFYVLEKDRKLAEMHLKNSEYKTIVGDFLDWDFKIQNEPVQNFSLIGNLPYESGSAMLLKISEKADQINHFVFLLQKEVVERICAKPKTSDFASFSVFVQGQFEVEALDIIPPECFDPSPKVFSQIVRGKRRETGRHPLDIEFQKFLKRSFLHKRKTARNAWKSFIDVEKIDQLFEKFNLPPTTRAEEIDLDLWPKLFAELKA